MLINKKENVKVHIKRKIDESKTAGYNLKINSEFS